MAELAKIAEQAAEAEKSKKANEEKARQIAAEQARFQAREKAWEITKAAAEAKWAQQMESMGHAAVAKK